MPNLYVSVVALNFASRGLWRVYGFLGLGLNGVRASRVLRVVRCRGV